MNVTPSTASIDFLPSEVLLVVLKDCLGATYNLKQLAALTWICKRWRALLEGSPVMWRRIKSTDPLPLIQKAIHLSNDIPLHVILVEPVGPEDRDQVLEASAARWEMVTALTTTYDTSALGPLATAQMGALKSLSLSCDALCGLPEPPDDPIALFGGAPAPPTLTVVTISAFPIALPQLQLSSLISLSLWMVDGATLQDIFSIIENSPGLKSLSLHYLYDYGLPDDLRTIDVNHLETINMSNLPPQFSRLILSTLVACNLRRLDIRPSNGEIVTLHILSPEIPNLTSSIRKMVSEADEISISVGCFWAVIAVGPVSFHILLNDSDSLIHSIRELVEWMYSHLGGHVCNLPIRLSTSSIGFEFLRSIGSEVKITILSILKSPSIHHTNAVIVSLSESVDSKYVLPDIEVYEFDENMKECNSASLTMIRNRNRPGAGGNQPLVAKRMREIHVGRTAETKGHPRKPDLQFMRALVEAGNGANVYYRGERWSEELARQYEE